MYKAVDYVNCTAFHFGCGDLYMYQQSVYTEVSNCCFEWYGTEEKVELNAGGNIRSTPKEIEIYQLY